MILYGKIIDEPRYDQVEETNETYFYITVEDLKQNKQKVVLSYNVSNDYEIYQIGKNIKAEIKIAEDINLKINIDVINTYDEENENVIRPLYECKLNGKIKETKDEIKGTLGDNYILKRDEESGELYIKEINEQLSFNDMEGEDEDDRF